MNDIPTLSIVTPSFNQAPYLETALRSVLDQGYPRLEYWVIDGGSQDGSIDIIRRYADRLAGWASEQDQGQAHAINKGLQQTHGEIVAWLNSDDLYLPGSFQQAVDAFREHPHIGMVYGDGIMVDSDLRVLDYHRYPQVSLLDLLSFEVILQPAVFMRRSVLEEVGFLDTSYHLILDHELWIRIASHSPVLHIPSFWALERTHKQAKTIAQAEGFVAEAERLIASAADSAELGPSISKERRRVQAGLNVFAARRLIDAGDYRNALSRLMAALRQHPATVGRYWYKVVQAGGSALGFAWAFEWYRSTRRALQYRGKSAIGPAADHGS